VLHNAADLTQFEAAAAATPPRAVCCKPAPGILEFDQAGKLLRAWGGPGNGYQWPKSPHGLAMDYKGNLWIGGNVAPDSQILKFTQDGKFLLQIGKSGETKGNSDLANVGSAADTFVDAATNEVWVADGYRNHRVIVFDADTGKYKRHFGAYGNAAVDGRAVAFTPGPGVKPPAQFGLVHCVKISNDGLVYVCDRQNDRIQVFRKDGTYVKETILTPDVVGAVANDIAFSPDKEQRLMYVTDHASSKVWIVRRSDLTVLGSFGYGGHFGGGFTIAHNIATDSKGNLYVTEGLEGKRVQRFLYKGMSR
jgi:DNA-binding beta-propeller fold protein YncE